MGAGLALRSVSAFVIALFPPARALAQAAHISTGVTEEALHQSPVLFRHQTSQRQHHPEAGTLYPSAPSQPGKAFTKVTGSQAIWSHGLANTPSPTSFLLPHPAVATLPCCFQGPRHCGNMACALSVPTMKCSFPKMTVAFGLGGVGMAANSLFKSPCPQP